MSDGSAGAIEVVIVDPSPIFREALLTLIGDPDDIAPVADVSSAREAADVLPGRPGRTVVVTELLLPDLGGLDALRLAGLLGDEPRCLVVTELPPDPFAVLAADAGASGFLRKATDGRKFVRAIRLAAGGVSCFSPGAAEAVARDGARPGSRERRMAAGLPPRDQLVLSLTAQGMKPDDVGGLLRMPTVEVRTRRGVLARRLGLEDERAMMRFVLTAGLVHPRLCPSLGRGIGPRRARRRRSRAGPRGRAREPGDRRLPPPGRIRERH